MSPILIMVTAAALGIEVGWEPLAGGGHEYTIQIEPQLLGVLERGGEEIVSEVPPDINVRRYRVIVGTGALPREAGEGASTAEPPQQPPADPYGPAPQAMTPGAAADADGTEGDNAPSSDADGKTFGPDAPSQPGASHAPGKLPPDGRAAGPIQPANFDDPQREDPARGQETVQKPMLTGDAPSRPWSVLVGSVVLLCCSLGANFYLGWIAWEARSRYRQAVAKFRGAAAS
jgi:hypothetical protein